MFTEKKEQRFSLLLDYFKCTTIDAFIDLGLSQWFSSEVPRNLGVRPPVLTRVPKIDNLELGSSKLVSYINA